MATSPAAPQKAPLVKVAVLGDAGVGKTSLLQRYVVKEFSDGYKTTIGADFLSMDVTTEDDKKVSLQLWDTAGQERFAGLGNAFFRGANACVLVYDITNEKSFLGLKAWYDAFVTQSNCPNPTSFPFVLVGNKLDQAVNRTVAKRRAVTWSEENGCLRYFEASAKDATGVNDIFTEVAKVVAAGMEDGEDALKKYQKETSIIRTLATDQRAKEKEEDHVCC